MMDGFRGRRRRRREERRGERDGKGDRWEGSDGVMGGVEQRLRAREMRLIKR